MGCHYTLTVVDEACFVSLVPPVPAASTGAHIEGAETIHRWRGGLVGSSNNWNSVPVGESLVQVP